MTKKRTYRFPHRIGLFNRFTFIIIIGMIFVTSVDYYAKNLAHNGREDSTYVNQNPIYGRQIELYKIYKPKQVNIVMLGNSLTHGVAWNELLGRNDVVERGIVSDGLDGFLNRMDYVYKLKPSVVFIMGGANDVYNWVPVDEILLKYIQVINGLKARNIKVVIQSVLYSWKTYGADWLKQNSPEINPADYNTGRNKEIEKLNKQLKSYAVKNGIEFIDLNKIMTRGNFLRPELTWDGIHLKASGYSIWGKEVEKTLRKLGY